MNIAAPKTVPATVGRHIPSDQYARLVSLLLALITVLVCLPAGFHDSQAAGSAPASGAAGRALAAGNPVARDHPKLAEY